MLPRRCPCRRATALSLLLAAGAIVPGLIPRAYGGTIDGQQVTKQGGDDWNTSVPRPFPYGNGTAPINSLFYSTLANNGFGPNDGWTFNPGNGTFLQADVSVDNYYAWVVDSPDVAYPWGIMVNNHSSYNVGKHGSVGGAVFTMTYTQKNRADPDPATVHFLQLYGESLNGGPVTYHVDNGGDPLTPFYDEVGGSNQPVQRQGNQAWFSDEPFQCENNTVCSDEGPEDFGATVVFGVYLVSGNDIRQTYTVYPGYIWGFTYSNTDTPEPSTLFLVGAGLAAAAISRHCAARKSTTRSIKFGCRP